ncbi:MAG: preprotein translocase subunit SecE [Actinobacteria bacterium]|nr:preprotein translocase subunit SecE [Actinomycetota bacterium]
MNRELRRLQEKEEKRARERRAKGQAARPKRQRVGLRQFFSEVRTELKRVAWPSRRETVTFTVVTLITSAFVTVYTLGLDIVFKESVLKLVELIA